MMNFVDRLAVLSPALRRWRCVKGQPEFRRWEGREHAFTAPPTTKFRSSVKKIAAGGGEVSKCVLWLHFKEIYVFGASSSYTNC